MLQDRGSTERDVQGERTPAWRFADILNEPDIAARFDKVRAYFFLRESTYDMTNRCNIRCDGCYYYEGDKQFSHDEASEDAWRALMRSEKERGITFAVLAGAEPALVPGLLGVCYGEIPLGCIASNGLVRIPDSVGYRIHVSVWGNDATSERCRGAKRMLERQIANYKGDKRAVFVFTFTRQNIGEAREIIGRIADNGCACTFNMFSAPTGYTGPLRHDSESLARTRETMIDLLGAYPKQILFSPYGIAVHTHEKSLHNLFGCPYPRRNPAVGFGLGRSFRQFRSDLTWVREASCCVPDTDCDDCRHYASGSAVVTARMYRHAETPDHFRAWLDYVDAYLSVWVMGYEKGPSIGAVVAPPGTDLK
jgi:MoaA/NifB/PqqE/SkfB family radical SAM enzyme